ncbi:MAG: hypothetical protein LBM99_02780 [Bacillales bacterium]|jgi:alpha-L-rhamnosidase|nr:hypothetical protein [Bacillales bacterium]
MKAFWIKQQNIKNYTLALAGQVNNEKEEVLSIGVCQIYRLFVDGFLIGYGPARASKGYTRIDKYKIAKGLHYIVIEVVSYRVNSYYLINEKPFIAVDLKGFTYQGYEINDRERKVVRYSFQRPFSEVYKQSFDKSDFYLGNFSLYKSVPLVEVKSNIYLDRNVDYVNLKVYDKKTLIETGTFESRESPLYYDRCFNISKTTLGYVVNNKPTDYLSKLVYTKTRIGDVLKAKQYLLFEYGQNITGFINLDIEVIEDAVIYVLFDEIIFEEEENNHYKNGALNISFYRGQCCNVVKWTLKKGHYHLLSFEPYTFKYLKVVLAKGQAININPNVIKYENSSVKFVYKIENNEIAHIADASINTFVQNAVDVLTDCPHRERAGWLCDSYFSSDVERLLTGYSKVERNFLENYLLYKPIKELPKTILPMCYPADHIDGVYLSNWNLWYILELEKYYLNTNDKELLNKSKKNIRKILKYHQQYENEYGLLENLPGWVFVEWSKANDFTEGINIPSNCLYYGALLVASKLLKDKSLKVKAEKLRETINNYFYNGTYYVDQAFNKNGIIILSDNISETCQYYALFFNIPFTNNLFNLMSEYFGPNKSNGLYKSNVFIGDYLRLEVLKRNGLVNKIKEEIIGYFTTMAKRTQTLWENDEAVASCCHGFASYVLLWILYVYVGLVSIKDKPIFDKRVKVIDSYFEIPIKDRILVIEVKDGLREYYYKV